MDENRTTCFIILPLPVSLGWPIGSRRQKPLKCCQHVDHNRKQFRVPTACAVNIPQQTLQTATACCPQQPSWERPEPLALACSGRTCQSHIALGSTATQSLCLQACKPCMPARQQKSIMPLGRQAEVCIIKFCLGPVCLQCRWPIAV